MTACAPTTRNSAASADNAENRSLKSRFVIGFPLPGTRFADHVPRRREDGFGAELLPEVEIEGAVVSLARAKDAGSGDSRSHGEGYHAGIEASGVPLLVELEGAAVDGDARQERGAAAAVRDRFG